MEKLRITRDRFEKLESPGPGKQSYLWDKSLAGFGVRAVGAKKYFIVQRRLNGKLVQLKMGDISLYEQNKDVPGRKNADPVENARAEARVLLSQLADGIDPRIEKRRKVAEQQVAIEVEQQADLAAKVRELPVTEAWAEYIKDRRPRWSERHYQDHMALSQPGGAPVKRGQGVLMEGPLFALLQVRMVDLSPAMIESWLTRQVRERPTRAALAFRILRAFLNWCGDHPDYSAAINPNIITKRCAGVLPRKQAKADVLQKEQLRPWFKAVRELSNPVISAYLQTLLLTGARREELAGVRWEDVDFRWKAITIRDKVEVERIIPLTPFVESLLQFLPRRNEWVFSSPSAATGRIQEPRIAHNRALTVAGIEGMTLHGLRRSFGSLSEWVELPSGIVAQIMGHKPSATAEKHYRVRPLDLLRKWHTTLEAWILEQAGIAVPVAENKQESPQLIMMHER